MGYYRTLQIGAGTWYIYEPLGVGAFLFAGSRRALLMDTCNGFADLRGTLSKLTDKPVTLINSHGHADHAGGNGQFEEVYIHRGDLGMLDPQWQKSQRDLLFGYAKKMYPPLGPLLWLLARRKFQTFDTRAVPVEDGAVFDLGGRVLKVVHCPGHSPGSVLLTDEATQTLYAGDAVNGGLFLFFEGSPSLRAYAARLRGLGALEGLAYIRGSHAKDPLPFSFLDGCADFLERAALGSSVKTDIPNPGGVVWKYSEEGARFGLKEMSVFFTEKGVEEE
jgi:glyoxylase-like metal-dependent hydrolase (beta-lactamase superfamily II)